jgi:hypothetical protein
MMLNKHLLLDLFSNISSLCPCIKLSSSSSFAASYIHNCSFENILSNSPTSSCIDFHFFQNIFNFSRCSFRNITSLHPNISQCQEINLSILLQKRVLLICIKTPLLFILKKTALLILV